MQLKFSSDPKDFKKLTTNQIRERFLIQNVFTKNNFNLFYCYDDRMIVGGSYPFDKELILTPEKEIKESYFLERRELGVINIGGVGVINTDDKEYDIKNSEGIYIGKGVKKVKFSSLEKENPAKFYFLSCPAHKSYPTTKIDEKLITKIHLGEDVRSNERTIYKYIHPEGVLSCQLVMGMTIMSNGSMWNTMPTHSHSRRMEVYFYTGLAKDEFVLHLMGESDESRHIVVRNNEAVISPAWSIHAGVGTMAYPFIWGMCGENQRFDDMDIVSMEDLK